MNQPPNRRILLIDDTPSIHDDFRKILMPAVESNQVLDDMESALFGESSKRTPMPWRLSTCACPKAGTGRRP
jgi:two-component system NtrC family sensor kinase